MTEGPCRVVRREFGTMSLWDVYCEDMGDYLSTMCPSLPVQSYKEAQRVCDSASARGAMHSKQSTKSDSAQVMLPSQEWLDRKIAADPDDAECEAGPDTQGTDSPPCKHCGISNKQHFSHGAPFDHEAIIEAAHSKMREYQQVPKGQTITERDTIAWWLIEETRQTIASRDGACDEWRERIAALEKLSHPPVNMGEALEEVAQRSAAYALARIGLDPSNNPRGIVEALHALAAPRTHEGLKEANELRAIEPWASNDAGPYYWISEDLRDRIIENLDAQGMEAPQGVETTGSTEGDSPVAESDAPKGDRP